MKIFRRLPDGWSNLVENKDKQKCDVDGATLWINPGGRLYCDLVHDKNDLTAVQKRSFKK